ncbi:MAG TPA: lytic murein transglycosylase [Solirubrobacteraceae bacterium]|nr:lytic murein transglycosylase [Solirubrobacteraceae bacterium]
MTRARNRLLSTGSFGRLVSAAALAGIALALGIAGQASASKPLAMATPAAAAQSATETGPTGTSAPATGGPAASSPPSTSAPPESTAPETTATTGPEASPPANSEPQVGAQQVQTVTPSRHHGKRGARGVKPSPGEGTAGGLSAGGGREGEARPGRSAPAPSKFGTPSLPFSLGATVGGLPSFFIESFQIPPFLLPIFQAAGTAYGIPWQILAAINEVETDYGRDLSVSSAGAEGWMQFLPGTWSQYGVDANGAGYEDPYNPADAIFAAARYLRAAGGQKSIRAAIYSYNHSQSYVDSVMLRAQLLGGTPPELLGAIAGLTESQFPVHAPSHFSDGFQSTPARGSTPAKALAGTTIYSQLGAPVIAVQDGEVVQVGDSPALGRFVALRDAYGNTYVYAELGSVSALYPVLEPRQHTSVSHRIDHGSTLHEAPPSGPATAGAQPRSPLSAPGAVSSLALGAAAGLEPAPTSPVPAPATPSRPATPALPSPNGLHEFRSGPNNVYLHPLRAGVQVLAGTVLGHVGAPAAVGSAGAGAVPAGTGPAEPHIFFQIKPAGAGAPSIDPKPILDGWVALEDTSIFRAKGENPFLATSPTVGQVLLESKSQLEQQLARDRSVHMRACERQGARTGRVGKPVLAMLEYLSVSGLEPTVSGLRCAGKAPASEDNAAARAGDSVKITAIEGVPIAGHQGPGSIADTLIRKLSMLEGLDRPSRIVSQTSVPGAPDVYVRPHAGNSVYVTFAPPAAGRRAASTATSGSGLTPGDWVKLIARLGEIPDPTVAGGPSTSAIPDGAATATGASAGNAGSGGAGSGDAGAGRAGSGVLPSGERSSGGNG